MEDSDRRKRINRYKKIILQTLFFLVIVTIVLWIYIIFKVNNIEDKIDGMKLAITYSKLWR